MVFSFFKFIRNNLGNHWSWFGLHGTARIRTSNVKRGQSTSHVQWVIDFFITMSTDRKSSANQGASIGWSLKKILLKFIIQWRKPAMLQSLASLRFLHMQLMKVLSYISTINTGWRWREHVIYLLKGLGTDTRVGKTKLVQFTPLKCVTTLYESFRATTNLPRMHSPWQQEKREALFLQSSVSSMSGVSHNTSVSTAGLQWLPHIRISRFEVKHTKYYIP